MSANPALLRTPEGQLVPVPFQGEYLALRRDCIDITLDGLSTRSGKWTTRGSLFLSNMRLVFVADKADPESGLASFDLPLAYIRNDRFNQPIFGCNNLSGQCWPAVAGGGPAGQHPPHSFALYFKEGGCGTLLPLYFRLVEAARHLQARMQPHVGMASAPPMPDPAQPEAMVAKAFVDPSDPSKLYLAQPVDESQHLPSAPKYAANYGQEEQYEDMGLRP